jgi:hypothetical protein
MVASDTYLEYLVQHIDEDEVSNPFPLSFVKLIVKQISHCVSLAALWSANNKRAKGLRASGVGSVSCSRHEMFRPRGMADLQKGERCDIPHYSFVWLLTCRDRYSNMDYIWFSSLIGITLLTVIASYDIACQWGRKFWQCAKKMPAELQLPAWMEVIFKVPKFHLPPHIKACHAPFSFNFTKGVGQTDREGVKWNWSWLNSAARSVSVMGPGAHEDTINDFCGFSNWKKTVDLGKLNMYSQIVC